MSLTVEKTHKHQQLTEQLRRLATTLAPGDRFPSQNELIRAHGVSDRTVLRSLTDLQSEGVIYRRNGSGTFVAERDSSPRAAETLAVVVAAKSGFFGYCVEELTMRAEEMGLRVVCHFTRSAEDTDIERSLLSLNPSACLVVSYSFAPLAHRLRAQGLHVVVMGVPPAGVIPEIPCIFGDHYTGALLVTNHLLQQGHRRFAITTFSSKDILFGSRRYQATQAALQGAGVPPSSLAILDKATLESWTINEELARTYFSRSDAPTALMVWNDTDAAQWLTLLHRIGVRVPEDISVVG